MLDMKQGTAEWHAARCGLITASKISVVMSKGRSSAPSATRATYMAQLAAERLTGKPADGFTNAAMEWGTETEPQARAEYTMRTGLMIEEVGFVPHPSISNSGASPDGLAGEDGLVEIKCPNTATHIDTLLSGKVPTKYITQMQWQMLCCERKWCDFVSFDNRLPEHLQLFVQEVEFDPEYAAMLEKEVVLFLTELDNKVAKLKEKYE